MPKDLTGLLIEIAIVGTFGGVLAVGLYLGLVA